MSSNTKLEIACFNLASVLIAQENGADRVELCADMEVGGTTPDLKTVQQSREKLTLDLYFIILQR